MRNKIFLLITLILPYLTFGQKIVKKGLDEQIDEAFGDATGWFVNFIFYQIPFSENIKVFWVLFPLILGALYFTIYFKFINIRGFFTSLKIVGGHYDDLEGRTDHKVEVSDSVFTDDGDNPDTIRVEGHVGEVSHFQALTAALSATVGLGNIAGVAIAGPANCLQALQTA